MCTLARQLCLFPERDHIYIHTTPMCTLPRQLCSFPERARPYRPVLTGVNADKGNGIWLTTKNKI